MFEKLQSLRDKEVRHFSHNDMDGYAPKVLSCFSEVKVVEYKHCSYTTFESDLEATIEFYENHEHLEQYAILITDIAPKSENLVGRLDQLTKAGLTVVLLDHHDTNKWIAEKYPEWAFIESSIEDVLTSGTSLYLSYLLEKELLDLPVEKQNKLVQFVEHVREYDSWVWSHTGNHFAKDLNTVLYVVGSKKWIDFQLDKINDSHSEAEFGLNKTEALLVEIENKREKKYIASRSHNMDIRYWCIGKERYKVGVVYGDQYHSTLGNELSKTNKELDFICILDMNTGKGSLRTVHHYVHLGKIAKAIAGGGGHQKAAGFQFEKTNSVQEIETVLGVSESGWLKKLIHKLTFRIIGKK